MKIQNKEVTQFIWKLKKAGINVEQTSDTRLEARLNDDVILKYDQNSRHKMVIIIFNNFYPLLENDIDAVITIYKTGNLTVQYSNYFIR